MGSEQGLSVILLDWQNKLCVGVWVRFPFWRHLLDTLKQQKVLREKRRAHSTKRGNRVAAGCGN